MSLRNFLCAACVGTISVLASAQFHNPVIKGFHPDPSVCRVGEDFYLVNSSFQFFPGVPLFHSRDLVNWEQIGNILSTDEALPLKGAASWSGIFAPTLRYHDGTFYLITTNTTPGKNLICKTSDPYGKWSDPVYVDMPGIDPSLFWDEDGTCWYTGSCDGGIGLVKVDPDTGEMLSKPLNIWNGTGGRYPESPHIYKKDGWYYLLIAEGGTELCHGITIARSRVITGPYDPCPSNPIATHARQSQQSNQIQAVGHADFVDAPDGSWWMVCLAYRHQNGANIHLLGRETFLAPVTWEKNAWPVVNGDGSLHLDMDCKSLPLHPYPKKYSYDLASEQLGPEWLYLRNPIRSRYRYCSKGLSLALSRTTLEGWESSPTFVGRRQEDHNFSFTTNISFEKCSHGDECGVSVFMEAGAHYDVLLKRTDKGLCVQCRYCFGRVTHYSEPIPVKATAAFSLRVSGDEGAYYFSYSENGRDFCEIGQADARYLSTETVAGFTGIVLGIYGIGSENSSALVKTVEYSI